MDTQNPQNKACEITITSKGKHGTMELNFQCRSTSEKGTVAAIKRKLPQISMMLESYKGILEISIMHSGGNGWSFGQLIYDRCDHSGVILLSSKAYVIRPTR